MTKEQFIEKIAPIIVKYAPQYNILCPSAVISQAVLESDGGMSELAVNAHNYFGLKYRINRCPSACGIYYKNGSEQNANGSYTTSAMQWMKFSNMDDGVRGYFDFTNISTYKSIKGISDPKTYLENIKNAGYATSLKYVENLMNVIKSYNLTKYDPITNNKEVISLGYTNSSLVNYKRISPNKTSPRNHKIDTITIHCMAGNLSVESCGNVFAPSSRQASSNYGIGSDGRIGMYVEEKDRSWASSNSANDHRAITIEVANDGGAPDWHVSDKAMKSLINLVTDICKRNDIKKLVWSENKNNRINHLNGCNMTVHRDFANKSCPGDYLYRNHGYIANEVNKKLGISSSTVSPSESYSSNTYTVASGDTLSGIGSKTGVAWKTIADLNGIKSPYTIKVGQVLKLNTNTPTSSVTSSTSNNFVYQGIDYSLVFNPTYYANKYSDLKKAFGTDSKKLFDHFLKFGIQEGRKAISTFDVNVYKSNNKDLQNAFGNKDGFRPYVLHYLQYGKNENRKKV